MNGFFGIRWELTGYVWAIPVVLLIGLCYLYRQYKIRQGITFLAGKWHSFVIQNFLPHRQHLKALFFGFALFFLSIALLRPQWGKRENVISQEGRDVIIALDISKSMLATDCIPNRLAVAKKKIKQLLSMLGCERVGLILFSGSAFMHCPLTTDYSAFHMFLDHADVETISSGSTSLESALHKALQAFTNTPDKKSKLLVVFTDGEDFSNNLAALKREAQQKNMHIFTMGVGTTEGAPIPLYDAKTGQQIGHQRDTKGNIVISQLNEGILYTLSADVGGVYLPVVQDRSDLEALVKRITQFEKDQFEDKKIVQCEDKYHYFLLATLCCLLCEWIL